MSDKYKFGYGKPPKHSRFKEGQSGNPKGRPKGSHNFKTDVKEMLEAPVRLREKGHGMTVPTQKAALLRLRQKALGGDARALDRLIELARAYDDADLTDAATAPLALSDQAILDNFLRRHGASPPEMPDDQGSQHQGPSRQRKRKRLHQ